MTDPVQDPKNYKFGFFYFNKEDKRIFPPKRIAALGWTVNFANPYSVGSLVLIIVLMNFIISYFRAS